MILHEYRGRGVLPWMKNPFSPTSCFHHRPQANVKGRGKARQIYDIFSATLPQLPTAFSSGNFLSVRGCSFINSQHSPLPNTWPIFPEPQRNTLYSACNSERHWRTISSCLDLCSHYRKSDGLYSKSQLASTLYKLLRMWGASGILPLWWQLQASIVPFKGHKDSRASLLFFSNSSIFFLRSRKRNREKCSWRKLTTDFWSAINVFPVLFSVPFLEMCLAFSKHQHGIHAGHTYLKSHSWVVATNSGIPTFSVKLWLGFCTHITLHLSTPYLIYFFTA